MAIYLEDIPLKEAQNRLDQFLAETGLDGVLGEEEILLSENAVGRIITRPIWAKICSPHYHASAMDGYAVRSGETNGAMPTSPVILVYGEQAVYVDTGDPIPDWANAVIPIENVEALEDRNKPAIESRNPLFIRIRSAVTPWSHIRPMGEDIVATELVLPSGHELRPADLGAIAASGHVKIWVSRIPKVAVLPTGTELVSVGTELKRGDIIEYNSIVLAGQVIQWGGKPERFEISVDDFDLIKNRVREAAEKADLVLLNAGSSAGSEDFSAKVIETLGTVLVHGIAVRPGHPVILGYVQRSDQKKIPVIGMPGYPVSAALTGEIFVEPLLAKWLGKKLKEPDILEASITKKVTSPAGDDDYMRVVVGQVGDRVLAAPLSRGAGVITSLVKADGITIIPRGVQGLESGAQVQVRLYKSRDILQKTIFAIGSHDMTLDILSQFLALRDRRLISSNVGSLGGLIALRRGEAHIAGSHLLDPATGEYNLSAIAQYLPDTRVRVMTWVGREQGLMVKKGNPKNIRSLQDLVRKDVTFINRQRGAGTRVLLDYHLEQDKINPSDIEGYDQEEFTHLTVAAAISSNRVDCGLGIAAAAQALDLDFIQLFQERYDLIIPCEYIEQGLLDPLFEIMDDPEFRKVVQGLPGYDISKMGQIVLECKK